MKSTSWTGLLPHAVLSGLLLATLGCGSSYSVPSGGKAIPTELDISPVSPTIKVGDTLQFTSMAHFSDGSQKDVTNDAASWTSSATDIAEIGGHFDYSPGLAQGDAAGVATITVTYEQDKHLVMSSTDLTVTSGDDGHAAPMLEGMATVYFSAEPGVSVEGLKVDGRALPTSSDGVALSLELAAGLHRFSSPDGRHLFVTILEGQRSYTFKVLSGGRLTRDDAGSEAR